MGRPILIDADMVLYRMTVACEKEIEVSEDQFVLTSDVSLARQMYWDAVKSAAYYFGSDLDDCWHCFTPSETFRNYINPDYKAGRKHRKPLGYAKLRRQLLESEQSTLYNGPIEADDMLSILASLYRKDGAEPVIFSGDKDLRQIPGTHYWLHKPSKVITSSYDDPNGLLHSRTQDGLCFYDEDNTYYHYEITPAQAKRYQWFQVVCGDVTDNIAGCPGMGPVKSARWANSLPIDRPVECWYETVKLFEKACKGMGVDPEEQALLQARQAMLLEHSQYNIDTCEVTLWVPPVE